MAAPLPTVPRETEVQRLMREMGFDERVARSHLAQRDALRRQHYARQREESTKCVAAWGEK
jgi:hypothetical protein